MTAALSNSREIFVFLRCKARARQARPVFWAVLWASLAHVSWQGFKLAQVRLQPDAIVTGLPGFLFRLVIRPMEWMTNSFHGADAAPLALQIAVMMTICLAITGRSRLAARPLGGGRGAFVSGVDLAFPGRRESIWN